MKKLSVLISLFIAVSASAADIQSLTQDTQRVVQNGLSTSLVWWIPVEYWEETLKQNPMVSAQQREAFVKVLDAYSTFAIVKMETGVFGGITHKSRDEILSNVELKVAGSVLSPLDLDKLSSDAANFFTMMKPTFAQMMGAIGEGMEFIVYPNYKNGAKIIDPTKEGSFQFTIFEERHNWRLPLGSLLPPVFDEETNEVFPGNYKFNPFTGKRLVPKPEAGESGL